MDIDKALFDEEALMEAGKIFRKTIDGEPKNINPLKEIPEPDMRLYGINRNYFETEEELRNYCESKNISMEESNVLDYFREFAGRSDVIGKTKKDGKTNFYVAVDEDGYGIYNTERSIYRGEFIWEFNYGNIRTMYSIFRDRGIIFKKDVYADIDERIHQILDNQETPVILCRKRSDK